MSELQFKIQTGTGIQIYPVSNRPKPKNIRKIIIRSKSLYYKQVIQHVAIAPIVLIFPTNGSQNIYKGYDEPMTELYNYQSGRVRFNENKDLNIEQFDLTLSSNKRTYNPTIYGLTGKGSANQYFMVQGNANENLMEDANDEWIFTLEGSMRNLIGINTNLKPSYAASGASHMRVQMIDFSGICVCDQLITYNGTGGDNKYNVGDPDNSNISGITKVNYYEMINFYVNDTWERITTPYYHLMRDKLAKETTIPYGILL